MGAAQSDHLEATAILDLLLSPHGPLDDLLSISDYRSLALVCHSAVTAVSTNPRWTSARARRLDAGTFARDVFADGRREERALDRWPVKSVRVQSGEGEGRVFAVVSKPEFTHGHRDELLCLPFGPRVWHRRYMRHRRKRGRPGEPRQSLLLTAREIGPAVRARGHRIVTVARKGRRAALEILDLGAERVPTVRVAERTSASLVGEVKKASVCFLDDDTLAVVDDGELSIWRLQSGRGGDTQLVKTKQFDTFASYSLVAGRGNVLAATTTDSRLHVYDMTRPPGLERSITYHPQKDALKRAVSHDNIGDDHIRDVFLDGDWILLSAAQDSGYFLALNHRTGERVWRGGSATRAACMTSRMSAMATHYGGSSMWETLTHGGGQDENVATPGFGFSPGPSCVHFDHGAIVVGGGKRTMMGSGVGLRLWRVVDP